MYVGQPLDTVKVKMQTFPALYKNAWRCFVTTLKQEGIAHGLYAGTVPSLAAQVGTVHTNTIFTHCLQEHRVLFLLHL